MSYLQLSAKSLSSIHFLIVRIDRPTFRHSSQWLGSLSLSLDSRLYCWQVVSVLYHKTKCHTAYGFTFSLTPPFFLSFFFPFYSTTSRFKKLVSAKLEKKNDRVCSASSFLTPQIIMSQHHSLTPLLAAHQILISQVTFVSRAGVCLSVDIPLPNFPPDGPLSPPSVSH